MRYVLLLTLGIWLFAVGCSKEEVPADSGNGGGQNLNRRLKVVTEHRYNRTQQLDSLLPNAAVTLYYDPTDRAEGTNPAVTQTTGTDGTTTFNYLKDTTYYLWLEHPDFSSKLVRTVRINTTYAEEWFLL